MAEQRRPWLEHMDQLLVHLRRSVVWVLLGTVIGYLFAASVVRWLQEPLLHLLGENGHIVFTAPFEKVWVYLKVSFILGLFLTSPLLLWEAGLFLGPALEPRERKRVLIFGSSFLGIFVLGIWGGYRVMLPLVLRAAVHFGESYEVPFLTLSSYVNVTLGILLVSALMVEIPVLMIHATSWGWVSSKTWIKGRRLSIVINAILSAFLSPPDALSMILMMIPLQLLYESGIWGARVAEWVLYEPVVHESSSC